MKKAFIVKASVYTRVIVDFNDNYEEEAIKLAKKRLLSNLNNDYEDCIDDVIEDTEMPYGFLENEK